MMRYAYRTVLGFLLAVAIAFPASAAVVTSWDYSYNAGFSSWTMETGKDSIFHDGLTTAGYNNVNGVSTYSQLWWGSGNALFQTNPRSGIVLGTPVNGIVDTNGASAGAMTMTHFNNPVYGNTLLSGTVTAALELSARDPYNGAANVLSTQLEFAFYETPNVGGNIADVFILTNPGVTTEGFEYDGEWYTLDFTGSFGLIPESYIALLKLDTSISYYGWVTEEGVTTSVDTSFTISHVQQPTPTPEPATFVLLALGLGTLVGASRLRRRDVA
ncbi:THxN family PEP-CTERM protein [Oleidesulfovibrio sp.]|uniref:THxN family PEP-CTERM protein n=1 Tax=Oleidesulfovibrio sp. TaxID=2909707 RepID=UPI003A894071